jgi:hypothetical protein
MVSLYDMIMKSWTHDTTKGRGELYRSLYLEFELK